MNHLPPPLVGGDLATNVVNCKFVLVLQKQLNRMILMFFTTLGDHFSSKLPESQFDHSPKSFECNDGSTLVEGGKKIPWVKVLTQTHHILRIAIIVCYKVEHVVFIYRIK